MNITTQINKRYIDDFKNISSLFRHSKYSDAEQLMNQNDWILPIHYQDEQGNTLLHIAAQNGNKRLVKLCLRRGAPLNIQNINGHTALHYAFGYGYSDCGNYLIEKGADPSIINKDNLTCYEGLKEKDVLSL